ncbi:MAG: nodulation protein NfeD [Acidobacteria bacterium]|nr:nodulation protein NfeD [Acidobacteriota bacterium]
MRKPLQGLLFLLALLLAPPSAQAGTVVELRLNEIVHSVSAAYLIEGIEHAEKTNADAVLIWLNTPGGLETSMREMVDRITASRVPVIVYVAPTGSRAASAGFFILLAADVAVMAPGTTTGAASPIAFGGGQVDETLKKKITNDAAAYLRSFATKRGRHPDVAELAVTEAKSFTDQEALKEGLIDAVCNSREEIFAQFHGRDIKRFDGRTEALKLAEARVEPWEMTSRQRLLTRIIDPNIAFLLFVFGILGLYIELNHPGVILPGVAGGICLILALFAFHLLPVNYAGVLLIALAMGLFILEAKFVSHGILAAGGVAAMVLGALMLVEAPIPEMRMKFSIVLPVVLAFAAITVFLLRLVIKAAQQRVTTGPEEMIGETGTAFTDLAPSGQVFVHGEYWQAVAPARVPVGNQVRVTGINGLTLQVEPVASAGPGAPEPTAKGARP